MKGGATLGVVPFGDPGVVGGELSCRPRSELTGDSQSIEFGREPLEFFIIIFLLNSNATDQFCVATEWCGTAGEGEGGREGERGVAY